MHGSGPNHGAKTSGPGTSSLARGRAKLSVGMYGLGLLFEIHERRSIEVQSGDVLVMVIDVF